MKKALRDLILFIVLVAIIATGLIVAKKHYSTKTKAWYRYEEEKIGEEAELYFSTPYDPEDDTDSISTFKTLMEYEEWKLCIKGGIDYKSHTCEYEPGMFATEYNFSHLTGKSYVIFMCPYCGNYIYRQTGK